MKEKLLHPATIIAGIALFIALSGTSYAISRLPKNSVGSAQIKKGSVTSSKVKDRSLLAQDFKSGQLPQGEPGPLGTARAYGLIKADGSVDASRSSGINQSNVTKGTGAAATGFYCFHGLGFEVAGARAMVAPRAGESSALVSLQVAPAGQDLANPTGCPSSSLKIIANTRDAAASTNSAFLIWIED